MACRLSRFSAQESAYLAALQQVSRWGYAYGRLALAYTDDQGNNVPLRFAPQGALEAADLDAAGGAIAWQWVCLHQPGGAVRHQARLHAITLFFGEDGIVEIVADCNTAIASLRQSMSADAGSLSLSVAPRTDGRPARRNRAAPSS
jgi:hypothetical protein